MNDKAIVTLLIGDAVRGLWTEHMEKGWRQYAAKHGYDIVLIDAYLDTGPLAKARSPHWQKCLVLQHPEVKPYRHAVWVDADIAINHFTAPSIIAGVREDKVGCVIAGGGGGPNGTYAKYGITSRTDQQTNSGVLVMQPARHAEMMDWIYRNYRENDHSAKENVPLSFHLIENDLAEPIDPRFNVDWMTIMLRDYPFLANFLNPERDKMVPYCIHTAWAKSFFLHFISQTLDIGVPGRDPYNMRADIRFLYQGELNPVGLKVVR